MSDVTLRINEIFYSLQGEALTSGLPTTFIRLTGCPLRCVWCDTAYAFKQGKILTIEAIMQQVQDFGAKYVTVTGGEPLAQPNVIVLLEELVRQGLIVSLETSGALSLAKVPQQVINVMDLKAPDSQESSRNLYDNFAYLKADDQIKFVIASDRDYAWSKDIIVKYQLDKLCQLLFSPAYGLYAPQTLAHKILADKLNVRMQIQLHKYIWGDVPGV